VQLVTNKKPLIDGAGKRWTTPGVGTEKCAKDCDERPGCTSYEFHVGGTCGTYTAGKSDFVLTGPKSQQHEGWITCIRNSLIGSTFQVNCQFTIDNSAFEAWYNGQKLNISGDVHDWKKMKTFSFVPDQESDTQELMVKGGNWDDSGHCKLAGLLLHCQAKNNQTGEMETSSPWHNFKSDTVHWRNEASANSKLCSNNLTEGHKTNPTIKTLLGAGAMKIWDGNFKNLTLIGNPLLS